MVSDTTDTVTVSLAAEQTEFEGANAITYTATLTGGVANNDIKVTLDNGEEITILAGATTGETTAATQGDDVWVDGATVTNSIASVAEVDAQGNAIAAGTAGSLEDLAYNPAEVSTVVSDTIDPTYVQIFGPATLVEGVTGMYTVKLTNAPQTAVTVTLAYSGTATGTGSGADYTPTTTLTFNVGETEKTFQIPTVTNSDGSVLSESITIKLSATGGNYESLLPDPTSGSITTDITEILPSTAYLLVNTSNTGGGDVSGNQTFNVFITNGETTLAQQATLQDAQGQQAIALTFDTPVTFVKGQTYAVVLEHVSGSAHTNITDFFITDNTGKQVVLNGKGGNDNTTLTEGEDSSHDGVIYTITVAQGSGNITVSAPVGYDVNTDMNNNKTLVLDSALSSNDGFILDFTDLPTAGVQNLFGSLKYLDIAGDGIREDNTVALTAQDVLDLGVVSATNTTLFVKGEVDDKVNVIGSETWTNIGTVTDDAGLTFASYQTTVGVNTVILNIEQELTKLGSIS